MNEKQRRTACFTGHRQIEQALPGLEQRITKTLQILIAQGYLYFGAGGARGFDALASEAVLKLKVQHPEIHLILVLPFEEQYKQEGNWTQAEIEQYYRLRTQASKVVLLTSQYSPGIYYKRNRHLVDHSSICIAYMTRHQSGTGYTVSYAKEKGLKIIHLASDGTRRC